MERRLFQVVYQMLRRIYDQLDPSVQSKGVICSDLQVAAMYFWQVIHDRHQRWTCRPENWRRLPSGWPRLLSESQYSRRLKSPAVKHLINQLEQNLRDQCPEDWVLIADGKPLPVGGYSKDPDATNGYGAGAMYRGYKLHAIWGAGCLPQAWDVQPANVAEPTTAATLVGSTRGEGYLLGDPAYDSNPLCAAAKAAGRLLVAPRKKPGTGLGKGGKHHAERLRSIELTEHPELHPFARALHNWRTSIERQFGWLTTGVASLQALPTFIRRLPRVRRWVQAKLILNALTV